MAEGMLTPGDMEKLAINERVAREAFDLGQRRLADALETKAHFDHKATTIFTAFVTISLAVFGVGAAILRDPLLRETAWAFFCSGTFFVAAAFVSAWSMRGMEYGYMGWAPEVWLRSGVIDGDDQTVGHMLAYGAHRTVHLIAQSQASNSAKAALLLKAVIIGACGALAFGASVGLTLWSIG
ncbi:hypothetical protein [Methylocystis sp. SC2]|uniref:hypothetical protein n=1 Tax=Methylocystis sp. (strain SC2) TaxID=187303 RepID=UPI0011D26E29|nr:hypothetical protein [Methylocystis sp. SC2]